MRLSLIFKTQGAKIKEPTLICFPFSGGYSVSYRELHRALYDRFHLVSVEPPGHGSSSLPLIRDFDKLVNLYLKEIQSFLGNRFILFGHSLGGLFVYRLAQLLEEKGIFPEHIIISGAQPPSIQYEPVHLLDDDAFVQHLLEMDGLSEEVVQHQELMNYLLPILRADFELTTTFSHNAEQKLQSPLHIFNGIEDQRCMSFVEDWRNWGEDVKFYEFPGKHMYVIYHAEEIANQIKRFYNN